MKFQSSAIKKLNEKYELISSLNQLAALSGWDLETNMPEKGAANRGRVMAKVGTLIQKLHLDEEFVSYAEEASKDETLNDAERGIIRLLKRTLYNFYKLPSEFIEEHAKTTSEAQIAWREARNKNDYSIFSPYLSKIIDLSIEQAEYLEYGQHPYDALLDLYEEELTTMQVTEYFDSLRPNLKSILSYIKSSKKYSTKAHLLESEYYEKDNLKRLCYKILEYFDYDKNILRLDESTHPFSQGINTKDVRITTRYLGKDFGATVSAVIHEFGHALYDMQVDEGLDFSIVGSPNSLILHESQSRFWENIIGRNHEFIKVFSPKFKKIGDNYRTYTPKDYFAYFNSVKPSLIRVDADEVTYHFHIMIRFEIEKLMIERAITVKELPELWNSKYKEYLGLKPRSDREGILQDVHWSLGALGYFPTYSMGTILSNLWAEKIETEIDSLDKLISSTEGIIKIKKWLKENIHQYGATYTMKDLLSKNFKSEFSVEPWVKHINNKYKKIY